MTITFNAVPDTESYLRLSGLDLKDGSLGIDMKVKCGGRTSSTVKDSDNFKLYGSTQNYLYNLGSKADGSTAVTITMTRKGEYLLDDISIYSQSFAGYDEQVNALREEPLENIKISENRISGTVDLSKNKILCLSVPYSRGWSATVDGEKTEILRGNYMFMCLPLGAGHHDIEFSYCSPGLKLGVLVTAVSFCILALILAADRRKSRK